MWLFFFSLVFLTLAYKAVYSCVMGKLNYTFSFDAMESLNRQPSQRRSQTNFEGANSNEATQNNLEISLEMEDGHEN